MSQTNAADISINAQYIKDLSFENGDAPQSFLPGEGEPRLEVMVNVQSRPIGERPRDPSLTNGSSEIERLFEVTLLLRTEARRGDQRLYIAELQYAGLFGTPALPEPALKQFLLVEAPRLLFPFARTILANIVQDGNFPPLLLQPIDFSQMLREQEVQPKAVASA